MNFKRIFAPFLSLIGLGALVYGAYAFLGPKEADWKTLLVVFVLGLVFFSSGLGLLKSIKDRS